MSQIFTVLSADPEARTEIFAALSERLMTESVWLPSLNFLALLVNFLGFLLLLWSYPPKANSGSTASKTSRFQNSISGKKLPTIA